MCKFKHCHLLKPFSISPNLLFCNRSEKPVNSLFVAPAVTPVMDVFEVDSNNPGVRLYQYDPLSYNLLVSKETKINQVSWKVKN